VRTILGTLTVAVAVFFSAGAAAAATYTFTGGLYDNSIVNNSTCANGPCETFDGTKRVSGSFTTPTTLAAGTYNYVSAGVSSFSFSDGAGTTYANGDTQTRIDTFQFTVDGTGNVTAGTIKLQRFVQNPETVTGVANPPGDRFNRIGIFPGTASSAGVNLDCLTRGNVSPTAQGGSANACTSQQNGGGDQSNATASTAGTFSSAPPAAPASVPTITEWAFILLAVLMAGVGALTVNRKYQA
jgi:hypothetical protein